MNRIPNPYAPPTPPTPRQRLVTLIAICILAVTLVAGVRWWLTDDAEAAGASDGCMGYRHLVERAFGAGHTAKACAVMWCESRGRPDAVSPSNDHGLLQINAPTWNRPSHPDPVAQFIGHHWHVVYDAWSNLVMAQKIQHHYGWSQWSCA